MLYDKVPIFVCSHSEQELWKSQILGKVKHLHDYHHHQHHDHNKQRSTKKCAGLNCHKKVSENKREI